MIKAPRRRLFSNLVTLRPPKETSGETEDAASQEVSAFESNIIVPQGNDDTAERIRTLRVFDMALTPPDMAGSYGLPAWCLDTARLVRAKQVAKQAKMLPEKNNDIGGFHKAWPKVSMGLRGQAYEAAY